MAQLATKLKDQAQAGKDPYQGMQSSFADRLRSLIAASRGRIWIKSGYRSVERQAQLWSAAVKKYGSEKAARKWVAPPGKSNHNHGIAADLGGDLALAHRLAPQYGLRFPMAWENWHIEPVDGGDNPDAYTDPPDDHVHQEKDNFSTNISTLASMFGVDLDVDAAPPEAGTEQAPAEGMDRVKTMVDAGRKAGFTGEALKMLVAIGLAEGSRTGARNVNSDKYKSVDRGWWQWNSKWHPEVSDEEADDPYASAQHVFRVSGGGKNWSPWSTFKGGQYKKYLSQAEAAING